MARGSRQDCDSDMIANTIQNIRLFMRGIDSQLGILERALKDPEALADRVELQKQQIYDQLAQTMAKLERLEEMTKSRG